MGKYIGSFGSFLTKRYAVFCLFFKVKGIAKCDHIIILFLSILIQVLLHTSCFFCICDIIF